MSKRRYEIRLENWKNKATARSIEIAKYKSRTKELIQSRDLWKSKCKKLEQSLRATPVIGQGKKAKGHQYDLHIVCLLMELYKYGSMSLRSCCHTLVCLQLCLNLRTKIPSHTSLRNWLCKSGLHRIRNTGGSQGSYIVYVDESICFGSEKILLVLGVDTHELPKDRSLAHSDMQVLYVGVSQEWKGSRIAEELKDIAARSPIDYVVSDQGHNLKKAYATLDYVHIQDCTHIFANHLKKLYQKEGTFQAFVQLVGRLRKKWNLSKANSRYMPPSMRGKLRFANIFPCVTWAKKMIGQMDGLPEEVQQELLFLKENTPFITSWLQIESIFKTVCERLKTRGYHKGDHQSILKEVVTKMQQQQTKEELAPKTVAFLENVGGYLQDLERKTELLSRDSVLCSSDIIESYFGKFKMKITPNNRSGLTEFIFTIATFGKQFSVEETKEALETIKCKELKLNKITPIAA